MEQKIWHCPVCGQDFPGEEPPSPCPICGAPESVFTSSDAPSPKQWRCLVCGQVFDGATPPLPCPVCGAGEQAFVPEGGPAVSFQKDTNERFVLIGGGAASLECAKALRSRNKTCTIDLVCGEEVPPYNRPALSDVVADGFSFSAIALQEEGWYQSQGIHLHLGQRAQSIERQTRQVVLASGQILAYDKLLLATGGNAFVPVKTQPDSMPLHVLRSYADSQQLLAAAQKGGSALVVGGGILGLEAAIALRDQGVHVTVVEFAPRIIANQADEMTSALVQKQLERRGIVCRCNLSVTQVGPGEVTLSDGSSLACDFVLVAAGVRSETALAQACGLAVERGIVVDETLCTSDPNIYAAGDCAQYRGRTGGLWSTATGQGQAAGAHMAGDNEAHYAPLPPATVLEGVGPALFSCGITSGARLQTLTYEDGFSGIYKRLFLEDGKTVGVVLYGDTDGAAQAIGAVSAHTPANQAAQLLTGQS